jgi:hypothetical protein
MSSRIPREKFEEFVRHILAVPKADLDARLAEEKDRKKRSRTKRPPPAN